MKVNFLKFCFVSVIISMSACKKTEDLSSVSSSVVLQNEIKSCEEIQLNQLKDIIFSQIEKSSMDLNILFPTKWAPSNSKSNRNDDEILKENWEEFKNRSKVKVIGEVLEERYKNPKICTYHLTLSLVNGVQNFSNIDIFPRFIINKSHVSLEKQTWLALNATVMDEKNNKDTFLNNIFRNFRMFLMLNDSLNKVSNDTKRTINTLFDATEYSEGYYDYFEKNYSQTIGVYEDLAAGSTNSIEVLSKNGNQIIIKSSVCPDTVISAIKDQAFSYQNLKEQPKIAFYFDPRILFVEESENMCIKKGRYHFFSENL